MLAKDASAKDIYELKRRLKEQQKQRILERRQASDRYC